MCCAVSLWIRSLRMCTPMGQEGDDCHPMSHKVSSSTDVFIIAMILNRTPVRVACCNLDSKRAKSCDLAFVAWFIFILSGHIIH